MPHAKRSVAQTEINEAQVKSIVGACRKVRRSLTSEDLRMGSCQFRVSVCPQRCSLVIAPRCICIGKDKAGVSEYTPGVCVLLIRGEVMEEKHGAIKQD